MNVEQAFEDWLKAKMFGDETRLEFANKIGAKFEDLQWAFYAGYSYNTVKK